MIKVTRLNNKELVVNAELIEFIEQTPDSIISLTTGKKFAVIDSVDEIIDKVIEYRIKINKPFIHKIDENKTQDVMEKS